MFYYPSDSNYEKRLADWEEIEKLIKIFKAQFEENSSQISVHEAKLAADKLLEKFSPLFKKYTTLIKTSQIDWDDPETKSFVSLFIDEYELQKALQRKKQNSFQRNAIYMKFNFVKETYGELSEEEILTDLQSSLLTLAKRYQSMGKNFCSYVYNAFKFEVGRQIQSFIENPLNIPYKKVAYEDFTNGEIDNNIEQSYEDTYYEDLTGIPNSAWMLGENCSDIFKSLSPLDKKILVKYYLEEWNDKQIAEEFGMHINTVNQRRRCSAKQLAVELDLDFDDIKRTRRSGKKAVLPSK